MAQLLVRGIENEVKVKLKRRAKRHGRSMEEEAREILRDATKDESELRDGLGTRIASHFRKVGFKKGEIKEIRGIRLQVPDFGE
jgi:plasmid stability protein